MLMTDGRIFCAVQRPEKGGKIHEAASLPAHPRRIHGSGHACSGSLRDAVFCQEGVIHERNAD